MGYKSTGTPNLLRLNRRLTTITTEKAAIVARRCAAEITERAQASYDSGQTVYGDARPTGVNGDALTLVRTGDTRNLIRFTSDGGTKIRCSLGGLKYAKYLIGKYKILPIGNAALPWRWIEIIQRIWFEEVKEHMQLAGGP